MTEPEWLLCVNPRPMIEFLANRIGERKARLFCVACCRRVWHLFEGERRCQNVVLAAERYADGQATRAQLKRRTAYPRPVMYARDAAFMTAEFPLQTIEIAELLIESEVQYRAVRLSNEVFPNGYDPASGRGDELRRISELAEERTTPVEAAAQATLFRDIFGNPFSSIGFDPAWRTSDVLALASGIYEERAFDRMPILADALQDAGCNNAAILDHCRGDAPHVRGCWVVDLILSDYR